MSDLKRPVRQDYVLRIRYQNTLPPPPFDPKLLKLPDYTTKYLSASFLSQLVQERPPNMDVDVELGMPIDLSRYASVFEGDDSMLYAPEVPQELDPRDKRLLVSVDGPSTSLAGTSSPAYGSLHAHTTNGAAHPAANGNSIGSITASGQKDFAYLRRTQYISSEIALTAGSAQQQKRQRDELARQRRLAEEQRKRDLDPERQIQAVDAMFAAANTPLSTLKHPAAGRDRAHLTAVEAFQILPDSHYSALEFVNVKYQSDPAPRDFTDAVPRLQSALIVPRVLESGDEYLSYFLPDDADNAHQLCTANNKVAERQTRKRAHIEVDPSDDDAADGSDAVESVNADFAAVRDYDAVRNQNADDYAIVLDSQAREARYVQLESRMTMRSRRAAAAGKAAGGGRPRELYKLTLRNPTQEEIVQLETRAWRWGTPEQAAKWHEQEHQRQVDEATALEAAENAGDENANTETNTARLDDVPGNDDGDDDDLDDEDAPVPGNASGDGDGDESSIDEE